VILATQSDISAGRLIDIGDTSLFVEERGSGIPLICLHGGPGPDHHMWGDYLDPLADRFRLLLIDQRSQGRSAKAPPETWTFPQMATDVSMLAEALLLEQYAVLGHSFGGMVALQHAVDYPGAAAATIVSNVVPSARYLAPHVQASIATFEPAEMREQVMQAWAAEAQVVTPADLEDLWLRMMPFQFRDPFDPRMAEFMERGAGVVYAPDVVRHFASFPIEVEEQLPNVTQPVLVIAGRHDRTCSLEGAQSVAERVPDAELVILEDSAHMTFVEENDRFVSVVREFLDRRVIGHRG
jgi:pimeloyl-ACP methyl ester carboxylesterase